MKIMTGAAALAASLALSQGLACAQAKTEISWWHAMGGRPGEIVGEFTDKFNAEQETNLGICHLTSTYTGANAETMTAAIDAFRAREQPHIVQISEVGTANMIAGEGKRAVYPVHKLMVDAGIAFDVAAYLPAAISYYTAADGELLSLPFDVSTPVLWYNKTVLEELGIAAPTTWDALIDAAGAAKDAGIEVPFSFGSQSWTMIENYSAWHDIPTGTGENGFAGLKTELTINNDAVVNRIQRIADMGYDGLFEYGGRRGAGRDRFVEGETVFWIGSSAEYGGFAKDITGFEFAQTMMPLDTDVASAPQNSIIGGAALWVLNGGEQGEYRCVAEFLQFLSATEQQIYWHKQTGYVPITYAAYEKARADGLYRANPGTDTALKELTLNRPTANSKGLRYGNFDQIRDIIDEELEAVWSGDKDAREALDSAVERGNELLRRFEQANE